MVNYKLYYFDSRYRGEPIRLMFAYHGQKYEDIRLSFSDWEKMKKNMPLGTLPILNVDTQMLLQSYAIYRYLAIKFRLAGSDVWHQAKVDEVADVLADFTAQLHPYYMIIAGVNEGNEEEMLKNTIEPAAEKHLSILQDFYNENGGPYLTGKKLTFVDFVAADLFFTLRNYAPHLFDDYGNLSAIVDKVYGLGRIKSYVENRKKTEI